MGRSSRNQPAQAPKNSSRVGHLETEPAVETGGLVLEKYDDHDYGHLRVSVGAEQLRTGYHQAGVRSLLQSCFDLATFDIARQDLIQHPVP